MSPTVATFVFETLNFMLLAAALGWAFTRPLRKLMDDEIATRARGEKEANDRAAEIERLRSELATKLTDLSADTQRTKEKARAEAEREAAQIVERARAQAEEQRTRMGREAESRRRAEIDALTSEVGRAAAKVVLDVFASGGGAVADGVLARSAIKELAGMFAHGAGHVLIECARPPNEETRAALRSALGAEFERAEVRIVPELVAGVRVTSDAGLVDASARGLARHTEASIANAHG